MNLRVLGLIPARGGSKGVPRKNIRLLAARPLLSFTAETALASRRLAAVILSTEDEEIADFGRNCGLRVPFLRPAELAEDTTPMLPVVRHALLWHEARGERFDAVCLLQPTNPLRRTADIDACIELLVQSEADSVFTTLPIPVEHHPYWAYLPDVSGCLHLATGAANPVTRRQDLPPAFQREGSVYVTRRDVIIEGQSLYGKRIFGFPIEADRSVNIDGPEDWQRAERLLGGDRQANEAF